MYNFDPHNVFLAIATNIPEWLLTGFVLQGHIYCLHPETTNVRGTNMHAISTIRENKRV